MEETGWYLSLLKRLNWTENELRGFLEAFRDVITDGLCAGDKVYLDDFGIFSVRKRPEYIGVDKVENKRYLMPPSLEIVFEPLVSPNARVDDKKLSFTADSNMSGIINEPFMEFEPTVLNKGVTFADLPEIVIKDVEPQRGEVLFKGQPEDISEEARLSDELQTQQRHYEQAPEGNGAQLTQVEDVLSELDRSIADINNDKEVEGVGHGQSTLNQNEASLQAKRKESGLCEEATTLREVDILKSFETSRRNNNIQIDRQQKALSEDERQKHERQQGSEEQIRKGQKSSHAHRTTIKDSTPKVCRCRLKEEFKKHPILVPVTVGLAIALGSWILHRRKD